MKIAFVGPHGHIKPDETLNASQDIDFVTRGECRSLRGGVRTRKPLSEISGVSFPKTAQLCTTPSVRNCTREELDALPFATDIYKRDWKSRATTSIFCCTYVSFYTTRGCPALCTFCMWPQTIRDTPGGRESTENVAREVKNKPSGISPQMKENFLRPTIHSTSAKTRAGTFAPVQAAEVSVVINGAGYTATTNGKSGGPMGSTALYLGASNRRTANPEKHQEGRNGRDGRAFMKNCRKSGSKCMATHHAPAGETRVDQKTNVLLREGIGLRDDQVSLAHATARNRIARQPLAQAGLPEGPKPWRFRRPSIADIEYPHLSKAGMMAGVKSLLR